MITTHTQLLNALVEKYNLKSYLEVGVQNPANNFEKIKCELKTGVDPETDAPLVFKVTSNDFFLMVNNSGKELTKGNRISYSMPNIFDLIFIDGDHTKEQVKLDFENSLRCLSDHGFIVIHDVLPENEEGTIVPRQTKRWWGDVYKFAMTIHTYDRIDFKTFNIDEGCMLVWIDKSNTKHRPYIKNNAYSNWEWYKLYGHALMNVTDEVVI